MVGCTFLLSGCESSPKQAANNVDSRLAGTWQGSLAMSIMMGRGNSTITQIEFSGSTAILTIASDYESRQMNYTVNTSSGSLVLRPEFRGGFNHRPYNGTQPQWNGTWPGNGTQPDMNGTNGSRYPYNGTWPNNGSRPWNESQGPNGTWPGNRSRNPGGRNFGEMTFTYRFDENGVLYLDEIPFTKIA